jgi:hypothetical protein
MLPWISVGRYIDAAPGFSWRVRRCYLGFQLAGTLMLPWVSVGGLLVLRLIENYSVSLHTETSSLLVKGHRISA